MSSIQELDPTLTDEKQINSLSEMDAPENMDILHEIGVLAAKRDVKEDNFPLNFNLSVD